MKFTDNFIFSEIDRWYWQKDSDEIVNVYYNPQSNTGGQFVQNYISCDLILRANLVAKGDVNVFFDILQSDCKQYCIDNDTELHDEFANEQRTGLFNGIKPFAIGDCNIDDYGLMKNLVAIATKRNKDE